jgi:hypothetical protein
VRPQPDGRPLASLGGVDPPPAAPVAEEASEEQGQQAGAAGRVGEGVDEAGVALERLRRHCRHYAASGESTDPLPKASTGPMTGPVSPCLYGTYVLICGPAMGDGASGHLRRPRGAARRQGPGDLRRPMERPSTGAAGVSQPPPVLALRVEGGAIAPWLMRGWTRRLEESSPRALSQGATVLLLDLSWQRGREREAARRALSLAPPGLRARAGVGMGIVPAVLATHLARDGEPFSLPEDEGERMRAIAPLPVSLLPLPAWARRRLGLLGLATLGRLQALSREALWQLLGGRGSCAGGGPGA